MTDPRPRSARSDSARNRAALLAAARTVFAEHGNDATLEEVARAANVSRTTLSRHFATRQDLYATLAVDGLEQVEQVGRDRLDDPHGVFFLFDAVLRVQLLNGSVIPMITSGSLKLEEYSRRAADVFIPLVERAAEFGTLRDGIGLIDVLISLRMATVFTIEPDQQARPARQALGRRVLMRAVFTDEAIAAYQSRIDAAAASVS